MMEWYLQVDDDVNENGNDENPNDENKKDNIVQTFALTN